MDLTLYKFFALCKCGEIHICMNCVSSIQSFLAKKKIRSRQKPASNQLYFSPFVIFSCSLSLLVSDGKLRNPTIFSFDSFRVRGFWPFDDETFQSKQETKINKAMQSIVSTTEHIMRSSDGCDSQESETCLHASEFQ